MGWLLRAVLVLSLCSVVAAVPLLATHLRSGGAGPNAEVDDSYIETAARTSFGDPTPKKVLDGGVTLYYGWDLSKMDVGGLKQSLVNVTHLSVAAEELRRSSALVTQHLHTTMETQNKMAGLQKELEGIHQQRTASLEELYGSMDRIKGFAEALRENSDKALAGQGEQKEAALIEIARVFNEWEGLTESLKANRTKLDGIAKEYNTKQEEFISMRKQLTAAGKDSRQDVLDERTYRHNAWVTTWSIDRSLAKFAMEGGLVTKEEYDEYITSADNEEPVEMETADMPVFRRHPKTYPRSFCTNANTHAGTEVKSLRVEEMISWQPDGDVSCFSVRELNGDWTKTPADWGKVPGEKDSKFSEDFMAYFTVVEETLGLKPSRPKGLAGECPVVTAEVKEAAQETHALGADPQETAGEVITQAEGAKIAAEASVERHKEEEMHIESFAAPAPESAPPLPDDRPQPVGAGYNAGENLEVAALNDVLPSKADPVTQTPDPPEPPAVKKSAEEPEAGHEGKKVGPTGDGHHTEQDGAGHSKDGGGDHGHRGDGAAGGDRMEDGHGPAGHERVERSAGPAEVEPAKDDDKK